ncbi:TonB-dependent receptor [Luteimonas sp. RD2P54]|uniref:TonB-dependent receptor n=1 Tax=Luteimonas endophytica TaxID=3042023 RepID=A0ABT6J927_9GAMM|nr:TonB-dependent receptor plug domain-containing protein [Luteimonas endophytica]MDH5823326.1 TonB-dependent receptor [Luteimonas endophytica]
MSLHRNGRVERRALASALAMALAAGTASAQEPQLDAAQLPPAAEDEATTLDRVLVTARKRTENIMEVPMNITVISATELNDRNVANVQDIYRTIAGGSSPTGELILRGLVGGNTTTPGTTSQFVDGIPFDFGNVFDVEQVEVLRGPQGTLWGSNAIGGTVQIRTRAPQFNDFELYSTLVAEDEKNVSGTRSRTQAGINIPLVDDTLAMRIAASVSDSPGKIVNAYTGNAYESENEFIRTQLRWAPTEDLDINFGHIWTATDTRGTVNADRSIAGYYTVPTLTENPDSPWGYDVEFGEIDCPAGAERPACRAPTPLVDSDPKFTVWELMDGWSRDTTNLFSLKMDHGDLFGIASAHYVGSYRKNFSNSLDNWSRLDLDDMARTWIVNRSSNQRTTHELRFQNLESLGGLDWTVGFFQDRAWQGYNPNEQWQYHDTDPRSIAIFSAWNDYFAYGFNDLGIDNIAELGQALYGNPGINYNLTTLHDYTKEQAAFGELSYLIETGIGRFELTGGIRYFDFEGSTAFRRSGIWFGTNGDSPYFDEASSGGESGNRKKFGVSYMPNAETNIYALYSEGYRPGGNNAPLPTSCLEDDFAGAYQSRYNSDLIDNHELGVKAAMFDRRLRVSSAIYRIDWSETWAEVYMPSCGFSYTTNTPGQSAKSQGLEFESSLALGESTMVTVNYGYTDTEMTAANEALGSEPGDKMTMVPRYNAYLALDQGFRVFGRDAFARVDLAAYGEFKSHFNTRPEDVAPAYQTVNLSGRLHLNDNAVVSVHVKNLFNEDYLTYRSARSRTSSRSALYERYGAERSVGVRFDYSF